MITGSTLPLFVGLTASEVVERLMHANACLPTSLPLSLCWLAGTHTDTDTEAEAKTVPRTAPHLVHRHASRIGLLPKRCWTLYPNPNTNANANASPNPNPNPSSLTDTPDNLSEPTYATSVTYRLEQRERQADSTENLSDIHYRQYASVTTYDDWCHQLIAYHHQHCTDTKDTTDTADTLGSHGGYEGYHEGLMGFIGYDLSAQALASLPDNTTDTASPLAYLGHYEVYLAPHAHTHHVNTASDDAIQEPSQGQSQGHSWQLVTLGEAKALRPQLLAWLSAIEAGSRSTSTLTPSALPHSSALSSSLSLSLPSPSPLPLLPVWSYADYAHAFDGVQHYLHAGDCYQINLTQPWLGQLKPTQRLYHYLPNLDTATQAPFAGYVGLADFELLSCSPELFFTFANTSDGTHTLITKPIKGTTPRGHTSDADQRLRHALAHSDKDKAENVMIVDLLRNDLGKYAKTGSVKVPTLFAIESFANVHHMVSTITADICPDHHPWAVLFGSLPAGSITGTPKKRAVELIHQLETAEHGLPRGAYCGTLGYLNFDGSGQWNVLIRTLQANATGQVSLWAGGGITVASECEAEYQECLDKVGNVLGVLRSSSYTFPKK